MYNIISMDNEEAEISEDILEFFDEENFEEPDLSNFIIHELTD